MREFININATTVDQAVSALQGGKAAVIAGGTDLIGTLRFYCLPDSLSPDVIVNLKTISPSLDFIKEEGGTLKIGACTRLVGHCQKQRRPEQMGQHWPTLPTGPLHPKSANPAPSAAISAR